MKRITLALVVLVIAIPVFAENVTVATIDVWSGLADGGVFRVRDLEDRASREFRYDLLSGTLADLSPDIIAIQDANPLPAYVDRLALDLEYDSVWRIRQAGVRIGPVGFPTNLREGSAVLAPPARSLASVGSRQLRGGGAGNVAAFQLGPASNILAVTVEVADRPVYVFTTRWTPSPQADRDRLRTLVDQYAAGGLPGDDLIDLVREAVTGSEVRRTEAERTLVYINEIAGRNPVILMGSFHSLPDSDEIKMLRDAGFVDVWQVVGRGSGETFVPGVNANIPDSVGMGGSQRIDYVFIRGDGIAARSARLIFNRATYGVFASDHFGIVAQLRVDPAQ